MVNGQAIIIGSSVNSDDYHYQMDVTHQGAVPISGTIGVTGSIGDEGDAIQTKSVYDGTSSMKFKDQMNDIVSELKKINIQLSFMTDEELNHNRRLK